MHGNYLGEHVTEPRFGDRGSQVANYWELVPSNDG